MIQDIIKVLQDSEHYAVGNYIEIAKGKNEFITSFADFKRKIYRQFQNRKTR